MIELDALTAQVIENCSISDSHHAGLYSVCGLALRLRDLYKWEKGLEPWVEKEPSELLAWIGDKEEKWETVAEKDFNDIRISESRYNPFDADAINEILEPHGLFYGAGYVHSLKPTFFLAVLEEKTEVSGFTVNVLGQELARDLLTVPALSQNNEIVLRKESAKLFLWDQIFFIGKSGRNALRFGLKIYGLEEQDTEGLRRSLASISESEMETYLYHEVGELKDKAFDRRLWREIIGAFPHSPIELLARSVKDLLADTSEYGPLRHIAQTRKSASMAFYVAFLNGLKKELFPQILEGFKNFMLTGEWKAIEEAISQGYNCAKNHAETLSSIFRAGIDGGGLESARSEIERQLLVPMGICTKGRV